MTDLQPDLHRHLRRLDHLVRAQTIRWRLTVADTKPPRAWGMVLVSDEEIQRYLESPFQPPGTSPPEAETAAAAHVEAALEAAAERGESDPEDGCRLDRLTRLFRLSDLERDALLLCLLPELDERYRRLYGYLMDNASRTRPTASLLLQILQPLSARQGATPATVVHRLFAPTSPLLAIPLLVTAGGEADEPLPYRTFRVDDRVAAHLLGDDRPDPRLEPVRVDLAADFLDSPPPWSADHQARLDLVARRWRDQVDDPDWGAAVFLHGRPGSGRRASAQAVCHEVERPLLLVDAAQALERGLDWDRLVRLAGREARLRGAALGWIGCEALLEADGDKPPPRWRWESLVARAEHQPEVTFLLSTRAWDPVDRFRQRLFLRLDLPVPGHGRRRRLWQAHLPPAEDFAAPPPDRDALATTLAAAFQLTGGQILDAAASARAQALRRDPEASGLTADDFYEGCRRQSSQRLTSMARRIEPRSDLDFDDLVLPALQRRQIDELRRRVRHRHRVMGDLGFERRILLGRGLIALFTGPSGTGKTMAAELLAKEQGVDLYKIDLAAVVSKWVGETEKNLGRVFDEAEDANAILLFDEADALFGKRGEVQEARDRWANLEVNYLLQRVEEYSGVVILTTNLRQNLDQAFLRRVQTVIEFPAPDAEQRALIWQGLFPPEVEGPPEGELRELAERFPLSGGEIKNAVVDAAFRALSENGGERPVLTVRHLVQAVAQGYRQSGKVISRGDFGDVYYALTNASEATPSTDTTAEEIP